MSDGAAPAASGIEIETIRNYLRVRLSRAEEFNTLTPAMVDGLDAALDEAERRDEIRALVVTGRGMAFCGGADPYSAKIGAPEGSDEAELFLSLAEKFRKVTDRLADFPKPTVAAVNGFAVGAGLELVLCCDLVVASTDAGFGDNYGRMAIIPPAGLAARLPGRVGLNRAKQLLFTSDMVPAEMFISCGLVHEVVPKSELGEAVDRLMVRMTDKSPESIARLKGLLNQIGEMSLKDALAAELEVGKVQFASADRQEGFAAFIQRRRPIFTEEQREAMHLEADPSREPIRKPGE